MSNELLTDAELHEMEAEATRIESVPMAERTSITGVLGGPRQHDLDAALELLTVIRERALVAETLEEDLARAQLGLYEVMEQAVKATSVENVQRAAGLRQRTGVYKAIAKIPALRSRFASLEGLVPPS